MASLTRMYSSRMRTARSLTASRSIWGWGGVRAGGACIPHTPWTGFLTHACENIAFPQLLLRAVKTVFCRHIFVEG